MSSEPPPVLSRRPGPAGCRGASATALRLAGSSSSFCSAFASCLILVAPRRQADLLDVGPGRLGDDLVEVLRPGAAEHLASAAARCRPSSPRALAIVSPVSHISLMCAIVGLAEVVPDRRRARDDVGLIAAVGDHVVRALAEAAGARGGSSSRCPSARRRRARCGRATALPAACAVSPTKRVLDRDQPGAGAVAPRHAEVVADVREERDVDVLEEPGADEVRLACRPAPRPCPARSGSCRAGARAP